MNNNKEREARVYPTLSKQCIEDLIRVVQMNEDLQNEKIKKGELVMTQLGLLTKEGVAMLEKELERVKQYD